MTRQLPLILDLHECRDKALVGGKAINLARLIQAGFPTPEAFVVTTEAFRLYRHTDLTQPGNDLAQRICAAWRGMGSPPVAVRSSATAEDLAEASMAGQYETYLGITTERALLEAVQNCWRSINSERIMTYLREHDIDPSRVAMAVVVQRLVPADVAGVMFTADPRTASRREMVIEASWGLGEAVVSGKVQPDIIHLEAETGRVLRAEVADKRVCVTCEPAGGNGGLGHEFRPVDELRRRAQCLRSSDVLELWRLGRRAAEYFGSPQDIEWAIHDRRVYVLQSRPITTLRHAEACEHILQTTRARLRALLQQNRGPWVIHNIAETLKHPTPLTWSVIRRFMSADGGMGATYREAGFEPSAKVRGDGFLELIAGRVYMDLSLAGEMFFADYPFRYDLAELRRNPDMGQAPPSVPCGTLRQRLAAARRMAKVSARLHAMARDLDRRLNDEVFPTAARWCEGERRRDLSAVPAAQLIDIWQERQRKVLDELGPQTLLPTLVAAMALADLREFLQENFWDEDPGALANELAAGGEADVTVLANAALWEVARGGRTAEQWIEEHGHRAPDEFDLATPRWRERRDDLMEMARRLAEAVNPLERHRRRAEESDKKLTDLCRRLKARDARRLRELVETARRYVVFRENGKHYLMLGYELLRQAALEAGRRLDIGDDVFFLTCEELFDSLRVGFAPIHLIAQRKAAYEAEARLSLPPVIDAEAIESLGQPAKPAESGDAYRGFAVSGGVASGTARIVRRPEDAGNLGRQYVLVCPSTDPGWTPLFANAVGLVLECGGTLSHGAVVAREMNIPAVVLPQATEILRDGQTVTVDGNSGRVLRGEASAAGGAAESGAAEAEIPSSLMPPVPGRRDRMAAKLRRAGLAIWGAYLAAAFILPERWLYEPTMTVLDAALWPLVRHLGRPGAVAMLAAGMAAVTLIGQLLLTDNRRLREAKRRAAELMRRAAGLPKDDPRAVTAGRLHMAVQMRIIGATMTPLALILGPMIMVFLWLPQRVTPEAYCAPPGSVVTVTATIDGEFTKPVALAADGPLAVSADTPAVQSLPPLREALEELARSWRQAAGSAPAPENMREALRLRDELQAEIILKDLSAYLKRGIGPQTMVWKIESPPQAAGRFAVEIRPDGGEAVRVPIVLGDRYPPGPAEVAGCARGPVLSVQVAYPRPAQRQRFWTPLAALGNEHYDPGWLLTYIAVYLPTMFALRLGLRIA